MALIATVNVTPVQYLTMVLPMVLFPIGLVLGMVGIVRTLFALNRPLLIGELGTNARERSLIGPINMTGLGGWIVGIAGCLLVSTALWAQQFAQLVGPAKLILGLGAGGVVCAIGLIFGALRGRAVLRAYMNGKKP